MDPSEETAAISTEKKTATYPGPDPNVKYPLTVLYCGGKKNICKFIEL